MCAYCGGGETWTVNTTSTHILDNLNLDTYTQYNQVLAEQYKDTGIDINDLV